MTLPAYLVHFGQSEAVVLESSPQQSDITISIDGHPHAFRRFDVIDPKGRAALLYIGFDECSDTAAVLHRLPGFTHARIV
jgi:hypothetical protein